MAMTFTTTKTRLQLPSTTRVLLRTPRGRLRKDPLWTFPARLAVLPSHISAIMSAPEVSIIQHSEMTPPHVRHAVQGNTLGPDLSLVLYVLPESTSLMPRLLSNLPPALIVHQESILVPHPTPARPVPEERSLRSPTLLLSLLLAPPAPQANIPVPPPFPALHVPRAPLSPTLLFLLRLQLAPHALEVPTLQHPPLHAWTVVPARA
mmetsp:Transcript_23484/g.48884  ORF Transcript_23484/g.48884 Transcript_23484/m.48884 type:complete len:206 (+) Transcript_23484:2107-2724(+)